MAKQCPRIRGAALSWPIFLERTRASLPRHLSSSSAPAKFPAAESHLENLWNAASYSFIPPVVRRASRSRDATNARGNFAIVGQPNDPSSDLLRSNEFFLKGHPRRVHLYSAAKLEDHPMNTIIPEIIVFGMSNAGKSTFINTILNQSVAKAGKKPGKTRLLHAYAAGPPLPFSYGTKLHTREKAPQHSLVIIDTPGYGYNSRGDWGKHVADYLRKRSALRGALVLVRGYTGIKDADRMLLEQLSRLNVPTQLIFTRMDEKVTDIADSHQIWKDAADAVAGCEINHPEWRRGVGWMDSLLFTAAGFNTRAALRASTGMGTSPGRTGNAGIMGARAAILSLAGLLNDESFVAAQLKREAIMRDTKIDRLATQKPKIAPRSPLADSRDEEDLAVDTTDAAIVPGSLKSNVPGHAAWSGETVSFEEMEKMVQNTKQR